MQFAIDASKTAGTKLNTPPPPPSSTVLEMLAGTINHLLGHSTCSGTVSSPYDVDPYPIPGLDIYNLVRCEEEQHHTRQLDKQLVKLGPVPSDPDYNLDFVPFQAINLDLEMSGLEIEPVVRHRPPPAIKKWAMPSAASSLQGLKNF
ncbi:hypothetical protein C8R44DRAFT_748895 [Mycena epipterygia]|nr:hypothetical protein C8R44DRAFT_748895 [Mycena epipterygia]